MAVNAMSIPAGEALDVPRAGWRAQRDEGLPPSYMLHGRPGVGKSQIVAELAAEIGARLYDMRLPTIEPQDLRGLPYYDHDARKTRWYRPEDLPDDPDRPSVLFLDELTAAQPYLQPTVCGLLQERRIGQHRLPASVFLVAAVNAAEDVASAILRAVPDRRTRNAMIAGTVGEAAAAEFTLVAEDILATVAVQDMIAAAPGDRWALYPASLHGLNALIYWLVAVLDAPTLAGATAILDGIRHLDRHRDDPAFGTLPLAELAAHGYELLIAKALDLGLGKAMLDVPAYKAYAAERAAPGLTG